MREGPLARAFDDSLEKSIKLPTTDRACYRTVRLPENGLAVLLCSDARAEKAGAAMNVRHSASLCSCKCWPVQFASSVEKKAVYFLKYQTRAGKKKFKQQTRHRGVLFCSQDCLLTSL